MIHSFFFQTNYYCLSRSVVMLFSNNIPKLSSPNIVCPQNPVLLSGTTSTNPFSLVPQGNLYKLYRLTKLLVINKISRREYIYAEDVLCQKRHCAVS